MNHFMWNVSNNSRQFKIANIFSFAAVVCVCAGVRAKEPELLPGTKLLTLEGDIASQLVAGVDTFLLECTTSSIDARSRHWRRDVSSGDAYNQSIQPNRDRLKLIIG